MAPLRKLLDLESAGGIALVAAAVVAIAVANSPLAPLYASTFALHLSVAVGDYAIDKSLLDWVNDGMMALFFFAIGLEIKREVLEGELRDPTQLALPAVTAVAGFVVPAAIYLAINAQDAAARRGWAIPTATDIAFALGVLQLFGRRVPAGLKAFLTSLAIFDDIGAIGVIAIFFTAELSTLALVLAVAGLLVLVVLNRRRVERGFPFAIVGIFIWVCVLKSGVHATLAGFAVGLAIPFHASAGRESLGVRLEHALKPWAAFLILPLFAFANAGVDLSGIAPSLETSRVPLGIVLGLVAGKQIGVMAAGWIMVRLRLAELPAGTTWLRFYGVAILTGIGFTMSLFIATLAFIDVPPALDAQIRGAVLLASIVSAVAGFCVLRTALPKVD